METVRTPGPASTAEDAAVAEVVAAIDTVLTIAHGPKTPEERAAVAAQVQTLVERVQSEAEAQ